MIDHREEQIKLLSKQLKLPTFANYTDIRQRSIFSVSTKCDRNSDFKILGTRGGNAATAVGGLGLTGWR